MGRADFFFAFGDENEIHGKLLPRAANRVKRGEKSGFRALLVHGAPAHHDFAKPGLIHERGFERWRRPFRRIGLLHVIHEIKAKSFRRARIQRGEDSRLAVGRHFRDAFESRFAEHAHGQFAAFVHTAVFRGDGRLANPILNALHGFVVAFFNLRANGIHVARVSMRPSRHRESCRRCGCCYDASAPRPPR